MVGEVTRSISVKQGTAFFFPLLNSEASGPLPVSVRPGREEAIAIALREYNLSRPAWESFKTLEQLELGNALWVIERAYQLRGV